MNTSEELRILVAEKVMGRKLHDSSLNRKLWINPGQHVCGDETTTCTGDLIGTWQHEWNPLESWADAGRVIERMADLGFTMTFIYGPHGDDVSFRHIEDGRYGISKGKSAPCHISLAALRALGVQVG